MKRQDIILIAILFIFAFALRFYDVTYPNFLWMDEQAHVPAARNYWTMGQFEPDNWDHPPLRHILLYGFLQVFGDNPYGWRMRNVLFGSLAVVFTALFAYLISCSRKTAVMAGLLLCLDPLHIVLSRFTYEEIYGGAIFLACVVLFLNAKGRSSWHIASALFLGCALATKWYYILGWFIVFATAILENRNYKDYRYAVFLISTYFFIPISIYTLSYIPWFGRGYSFGELAEFTINAYYAQQSYRPESYSQGLFFLSHTKPWEWFIMPVIVGQGTFLSPERAEFIVYGNNLPIWILTFPSMIVLSVLAINNRSFKLAMPVLFFLSSYVLYLFIKRPIFIYSSIPSLPFAFTSIAFVLSRLSEKYSNKIYYAVLIIVSGWNLYLYPFVTAKKIWFPLYRYIIDISKLNII